MKPKHPLINSCLALAIAGSAHATVLLTDNFNSAAYSSTFSSAGNLAADQAGTLAPVSYTVANPNWDGFIQRGNGGQMLLVSPGSAASGTVSLNNDFAVQANATDTALQVTFNLADVTAAWGQFGLGATQGAGVLSNNFGILFASDGSWQAFQNGGGLGSGTAGTWVVGDLMTFVFSNTAGTGSAFNGAGSKVAITLGATSVGSFTLAQQGTGDGYLTFGGYGYDNAGYSATYIDNLNISTIPEPGSALLGGLGMLALLRRRR